MKKYNNKRKLLTIFCVVGWAVYELGLALYMRFEHESGRGDLFAVTCLICGLAMLHGLGRLAAARAFGSCRKNSMSILSGGAGCIFAAGLVGLLSAAALIAAVGINPFSVILLAGAAVGILGSIGIFKTNTEE